MKSIFVLSVLAFSSFAFADAQVVLTTDNVSKVGSVIGMDIVSDTNFKGFQFDLDVTGATSVDLSSCTANVPKQMTVVCVQKGNRVRVLAVDTTYGTDLPAGRLGIGYIKLSGGVSPTISNIEFSDKAGEVIPSSSVNSK